MRQIFPSKNTRLFRHVWRFVAQYLWYLCSASTYVSLGITQYNAWTPQRPKVSPCRILDVIGWVDTEVHQRYLDIISMQIQWVPADICSGYSDRSYTACKALSFSITNRGDCFLYRLQFDSPAVAVNLSQGAKVQRNDRWQWNNKIRRTSQELCEWLSEGKIQRKEPLSEVTYPWQNKLLQIFSMESMQVLLFFFWIRNCSYCKCM